MDANTTGCCNTAVGNNSLSTNTTANNNTAVGQSALALNTTGANNVAIGFCSLYSNTTSGNNTAIGTSSLQNNTTGTSNTSVGYASSINNTTGDCNSAFGRNALYFNTSGIANTALGQQALLSNTTAGSNTAVGFCALSSNTTGCRNIAMGDNAGASITTGLGNIVIGRVAGNSSLTTGSYNNLLGYNVETSATNSNYQLVVSAAVSATGKGDSTGFINPNGGGVYQGNNSSSWSTTSDRRIKKNIENNTIGLEKINQIQVRNFEYKTPEEITEVPQTSAIDKQGVQVGVIAQEIELILPDLVKTESTGVKTVDASNLTWYLVNAIKELTARVKELENE
jgi:hypothetical protein